MTLRAYVTLTALRRGEVINIDGLCLKMDQGEIGSGDLYVAERNSGPKLLTAREVNFERGCIFPTTFDYAFDIHECVKVIEA